MRGSHYHGCRKLCSWTDDNGEPRGEWNDGVCPEGHVDHRCSCAEIEAAGGVVEEPVVDEAGDDDDMWDDRDDEA